MMTRNSVRDTEAFVSNLPNVVMRFQDQSDWGGRVSRAFQANLDAVPFGTIGYSKRVLGDLSAILVSPPNWISINIHTAVTFLSCQSVE